MLQRYACKTCESLFDADDRPTGLFSAYITTGILSLGILGGIATKHVFTIVLLSVMLAIRWFLYFRSAGIICPACKSRECIGTDTPAGKRIAALAATPASAADHIDFKAATPEEQAILDDERRARQSFKRS